MVKEESTSGVGAVTPPHPLYSSHDNPPGKPSLSTQRHGLEGGLGHWQQNRLRGTKLGEEHVLGLQEVAGLHSGEDGGAGQ